MKARIRLFLATALVALVVLVRPAPARADTGAAVYDDLKVVITQLIEHRVANGAADFVERVSPALRFYLHRTLDRVRNDNWNALKDALLGDLADIVSDYAFWTLLNAPPHTFADFAACFEPRALNEPTAKTAACAQLREQASTPAGLSSGTLFHVRCEISAPEKKHGEELACSVAAVARALFIGRTDEGTRHLDTVLANAASFLSPSFERQRARDSGDKVGHHTAFSRWLARIASKNSLSWLFDANRQPSDVKAMLDECRRGDYEKGPSRGMRDRVASATPPNEKKLAILCLNAWLPLDAAFTATLNGKPTSSSVEYDDASSFDDVLKTGMGRPLGSGDCGVLKLGKLAWKKCGPTGAWQPIGGHALSESAVLEFLRQPQTKALADEVDRELDAQSTVASFSCSAHCPFEAARLAMEVATFERQREMTLTGTLEAAVEGLRRLLAEHRDELEEIEAIYASTGADAGAIRVIRALQAPENRREELSSVASLFHAMVHRKRSEFATSALRIAFAEVFDAPNVDATHKLYAAFIVNFVNYSLAEDQGNASEASRDGLRVSASRLIDRVSTNQGYYRSQLALYPVASLRFSWNPGYISATSGDGFRYIASVDWPTIRTLVGTHAAVQFTMFDLAAPLAEIALRKTIDYNNQGLVFIDVIRPRLNLLLGIPEITRNVVISVGVSARLLAVCNPDPQGTCGVPSTAPNNQPLTYRTTLADTRANNQIPEVNLGVSYVF